MYDPYTDDRRTEALRQYVVLQPSGRNVDTNCRKNKYQEQQLEATENLDSQTQPYHPVYKWAEDTGLRVDVSTGAVKIKAAAPDVQSLVTEMNSQNKHKHPR